MKMSKSAMAGFAALTTLGFASPLLAQASDPVADQLRKTSTATVPADQEVVETRNLNTGIVERNLAAERQDQANAASYSQATARYEAESATAREAREAYEASVRSHDESQRLYEQRMADWRATVAACERGERQRCLAGQTPPAPQN